MTFLDRIFRDEKEKKDVLERLDSLEDRTDRLERILDVESEETIRLEQEEGEWSGRGRRSRNAGD